MILFRDCKKTVVGTYPKKLCTTQNYSKVKFKFTTRNGTETLFLIAVTKMIQCEMIEMKKIHLVDLYGVKSYLAIKVTLL